MVGMPGALEDVSPAVPAKGFRDGETPRYCMEQKMVAQKIAGNLITLSFLQYPENSRKYDRIVFPTGCTYILV